MKPSELFPEPVRPHAVRIGLLIRRLADAWPMTALGMAVALVATVALVSFGFEKLDLVLLVLGYGGIGLLVLSVIAVVVAAFGLWLSLRRRPPHWSTTKLETGTELRTGFTLPGLWWFPMVQVRWRWESPGGATAEQVQERGRLVERVTLARRGIFESVTRRIVVQDAFGLARIAFRHRQEGPVEALPHVGGMRRLPVLTSLTGGEEHPHPMGLEDGDRVELRRYVPGDSARFIHWKVFGRTRKLMVRVPERALSRARRTVAYLISGAHDEATAAAARAAIEEEALGADWQFAADGAPDATSNRQQALRKIIESSAFDGPSGSGIKRFLAEVEPRGPAALVVFAPPTMGTWIDEMRNISMRRYGRVRVVIGVDAVHGQHARPAWQRWLLRPTSSDGIARGDLERVGRVLSQLRCEIVIVDRVTGRILGDGIRFAVAQQRAA